MGRERRHSEARGMGLRISLLFYADRRAMTRDLPTEQPHPLALRHEGSPPRRAKKLVVSNAEPPVVPVPNVAEGSAAEPCGTRR
jgi:hypothetical protein